MGKAQQRLVAGLGYRKLHPQPSPPADLLSDPKTHLCPILKGEASRDVLKANIVPICQRVRLFQTFYYMSPQ